MLPDLQYHNILNRNPMSQYVSYHHKQAYFLIVSLSICCPHIAMVTILNYGQNTSTRFTLYYILIIF